MPNIKCRVLPICNPLVLHHADCDQGCMPCYVVVFYLGLMERTLRGIYPSQTQEVYQVE